MSERAVAIAAETTLLPGRDARLVPYCVLAIVPLGASLVSGQIALAGLSAPFLIALAYALRWAAPVLVQARVRQDTDQVLEGDVVAVTIELEWNAPLAPQVLLHRLRGVEVAAFEPPAAHTAVRSCSVPVHLRAVHWGRHGGGEVWLRLRGPLGLLTWTGRVATVPTLRVLPHSERLTRLLEPAEYRAALGAHRSRRIGDGHEFAEIRPYAPGDRLRDLNWSASARRRRPLVNRHHPELSGDVVIVLDAFEDESTGTTRALARAARAAWALTSIHLRAFDRVGLASLGGRTQWLAPANGRRARYQLMEMLLSIGGDPGDRRSGDASRIAVPSSALIVALSPLHDDRIVRTLHAWRARGRSVTVLVPGTSDSLEPPDSTSEALAWRVWRIQQDQRRRALTDVGIPVVPLPEHGTLRPVVAALRRMTRRRAGRSA